MSELSKQGNGRSTTSSGLKSLGRYDEDGRHPGSKTSTIGRYSEDSRAYLDSSRPSTLSRSEQGRYDTEGSLNLKEESEKERLVIEPPLRVSILTNANGNAATESILTPSKNYSLTTPNSNSTLVPQVGNCATTPLVGNCSTVPRAGPGASSPPYFGGRFSTQAGPGSSAMPATGTHLSSTIPMSGVLSNSLTGAANGHVAGGGVVSSNNNNSNPHRRRNNGGPASSSQTSMPC